MFERFTDKARQVVVGAQAEARERKADEIRTEHLLAAIFTVPDNLAITVLGAFSVDKATVTREIDDLRPGGGPAIDAEALSTLGIDLDEVRRQVEEAFGPGALDRTRAALGGRGPRFGGHIPFAKTSKKALQLALREAIRLKHNYIGTEHILLGLLHGDGGAAYHILVGRGVRLDAARVIVEELVRGRRAG
jgi:ATP-dependent Clp protease ATP-binding subunit ClpA